MMSFARRRGRKTSFQHVENLERSLLSNVGARMLLVVLIRTTADRAALLAFHNNHT